MNIDYSCLHSICGTSKQAAVYGFSSCKYAEVASILSAAGSPLEKVFNWSIGYLNSKAIQTVEGTEIEQLKYDSGTTPTICKITLVNIVLENYKRSKSGLPSIPVIFCVAIDRKLSADQEMMRAYRNVASKEPEFNYRITLKELRICYKLCYEFKNREINELALKTFKFVKVKRRHGLFFLEETQPFWEQSHFAKDWADRKTLKTNSTVKQLRWEDQLETAIAHVDKEQV